MPRHIAKIKDKYLEWSTVVDAPVTYGMALGEFTEYYKDEYGDQGLGRLSDRLDRVNQKGTSSHLDDSVESLVCGNRAGPSETELTLDEIYQVYCLRMSFKGKVLDTMGWRDNA